jgi:hypothetical protein
VLTVVAPVTRGTLWSQLAAGAGMQLVGSLVAINVAAGDGPSVLVYGGWVLTAAGTALTLVALIAFGVVLGSHAYRHERP